ncbi:WhiB family transcriptional regulator [Streptomyces sp. AK02-04a]|uniref:WhiB family transcriptional regulator n=1 Tax=Streptomyces sp. AK02-04a TaxID=3028649 RepID=UPI0029A6259E|nr:WhiB family transcriptional regulator [Streptomyces sp. AK02-04a]MDX3759296.1 WhiB family transcriptional regulator [Streptomyces sp. AK02-04a]
MSHYTGAVPNTKRRDPVWQDDAVCRRDDIDKELFFPDRSNKKAIAEARKLCWTCPVIQRCLEYAYRNQEDRGTWGGLTEWERRARHGRSRKDTGRGAGIQAPGRRSKAAA